MDNENFNKLVEILEQQSQLFTENNLQKDCKSKIYERLNMLENKINKLDESLKGNDYSSGLINKIDNIEKVVEKISDYIKSQQAQLKLINWIITVIGFGNLVAVLMFLSK